MSARFGVFLIVILFAAVALFIGFSLSQVFFPVGTGAEPVLSSVADTLTLTSESEKPAAPNILQVGQRRPSFRHGRTDGTVVAMDSYNGQVVLVNFWATWCGPCREEMPLLQDWADRYSAQGFFVLGIALDDVAQVRQFSAEFGIRYPLLVGGPDVLATSLAWGNQRGILPYSVLVGRDGIVRWTHFGPVDANLMDENILPLLAQ